MRARPDLSGDVGKGAVAIVFEEVADGFLSFGEALEPPAVDEEDVEPVVVVVVEESRAAAGGFEQILVAVLAAEDGLDVEAGVAWPRPRTGRPAAFRDGRSGTLGSGAGLGRIGWASAAAGFLRFSLLREERTGEGEYVAKGQNEGSAGERLQKSATGERQDKSSVGLSASGARSVPERCV